jgi:replicative DNA helicase
VALVGGNLVPVSLEEAAEDFLQFVEKPGTRFGTGWSIDDACGQVGTGEMALMWARSGAGKSTWMLNIIANTPQVPTVVVNMEMTPRRQQEWLTAMTYDISVPSKDIENVLRWGPDDPHHEEVVRAFRTMHREYAGVHFLNPTHPTVEDLAVAVDDIEDSTGLRPKRVFIDHLTLLADAQDYTGVCVTAGKLHSWAMREDLAVFVLQQTGRGGGQNAERNNGHIPIDMNSGLYGGEADADWVFGLYRPDKDPKFSKNRRSFKNPQQYWDMRDEYQKVKGIAVTQVVKNRPFGDTLESGIELQYDAHTRRFIELGLAE